MNTRFLSANGGVIAYEVHGSGPLVICVPGMGDLRAEYRRLAPHLATAGYQAVLMDIRGHGESSAEWNDYSVAGIGRDILALIREMNSGPAVIVGTSMAAGAAVWAAAEGAELTRAIVLIGPFVSGEASPMQRRLFSTLFHRPWGAAMWKSYYARLYPCQKPEDFSAYSQDLQANLNKTGRLEALVQMMLASKWASEVRLEMVKSPAMILMGNRDPDFKDPEGTAIDVARQLNGVWHMIPDAGHYPHVEQVEVLTEYLLPFLAEVGRAA